MNHSRVLITCLATLALFVKASDVPETSDTGLSDGLTIGARDPKVFNEIDNILLARMRSEHVEPSGLCTDYEFVRRVYIDVVGMIPNSDEVRAFMNDKNPQKRSKLIDKVLADNERYADHWEVMWGDWLREHTVGKKEGAPPNSYRQWLQSALKSNMPYDKFVRDLITATGYPSQNAATNFYMRDKQDRVETVNTVAQAFMGSRMACAQCHDHPFDKWTQDDFHGLMAFFATTDVTKAPKVKKGVPVGPQEEAHVVEKPKGEYHMPKDGDSAKKKTNGGEVVKPRFAWDPSVTQSSGHTRRETLADAVINSKRFPQVQANRLWAQLMGRGIVEPADDFREKNPPSHPELLDYLSDVLVKAKYDSKAVLREILNSAAYQRSSIPNDTNRSDMTLFSHQHIRRMTAEELFDSILVASGHEKGLSDMPDARNENNKVAAKKAGPAVNKRSASAEWATDLPTPAKTGTFMNVFNQPPRNVVTTRRDEEGAVTQALEMLNGKLVNESVRNSPLIEHLAASKSDPRNSVVELYLSTLTRTPTPGEVEKAVKYADASKEWLIDLQWALMNTREFTFVK